MQSNQLPAAKAELEKEIRATVYALVNDFEQRSGVGVESVTINMIDFTSLQDERSVMQIGCAEVTLSL